MTRIAVLATLDTKPDETMFVANRIRGHGQTPWLVDLSLRDGGRLSGDTSRETVARAASLSSAEVAQLQRAAAMEVIARGASRLIGEMVQQGELQGVIGIGGGTGTWMGTTIMRSLPLGFPKVMVSTLGSRDGRSDIMVMPSVADIAGMNRVLSPILANAAAAICGMAEAGKVPRPVDRPTLALTMFGVTTIGANFARRFLEDAGFEVVVFHANGNGGATMEDLIRHGTFAGVLDWTTTEAGQHLTGGICTAGPTRLDAAAETGLPQVVVPGAIDVINISGAIPKRLARRVSHMHLPTVPLVRTSVRESREIGAWIADKLNRATGPVRVLIPAGGYSALDIRDGVFWDPPADEAFVAALRRELRPDIPIQVVPHHINDEAFARVAADAMLSLGVGNPARVPILV
jgi:uncharacterized protein (UPF0261 family)